MNSIILFLLIFNQAKAEILDQLNDLNPRLFEYYSNQTLSYDYVQFKLRNIIASNASTNHSCFISKVDSIIKRANEHRANLQTAATFIANNFYEEEVFENHTLRFPQIDENAPLGVKCSKSALDCIEDVAYNAK